ncbi:ATP-binding protein [Janthinobacterium sp. EB271-G4-7A]|uniref:ATP-binding protein n=1 Tax=Janthinobacterium sp. EB271-G4-7A TaxID=2775056 RepID=UPI001E621184|nr:ATP-binding protein [Janthinobacterium sp. EB271-G4-7A]MCC7697804.1 response regulator [Janthinobacterium sp. EB271-G4-7A]
MRRWRAGVAAFLLAACCMAAQGQEGTYPLSAAEQAWVRAHPVLKLGMMQNRPPFETIQRGAIGVGIGPDYMKVIERHSGLTFDIVTLADTDSGFVLLRESGIDCLPTVRSIGTPPKVPGVSYSLPYLSTKAIAVTRGQVGTVADGIAFDGKTVVLPAAEAELFGPFLRQRYDGMRIVVSPTMRQALALLSKGGADVAIGSKAQLLPDLMREEGADLHFTELPVAMTSEVRMALRDSDPLLESIVNKSLATMTPAQIRLVRQDWLGGEAGNHSNMLFAVDHFGEHVGLAAALLLILAGLAYQAYSAHRRALRNERRAAMFLAVMSHEIRSPMNAVLAAVELLRSTPMNAEQRHFVDLASNGGNILLRLLDDVLDVSKLEAGQLTLSLDPVDVAALASDVAALQQLRAREKGITLDVTAHQTVPRLMLDEARLLQVLHNLVSNAIKFTATGGVEIQIAMLEEGTEQARLEIAVADTGIGIGTAMQATLFRPYVQVEGTYKRSGGTGLGLVICRELVTLMQGTITIDSEMGRGTRMVISLPVELATGSPPAVDVAVARPGPVGGMAAQRLFILVVEDVPANQAVLRAQLASLGCDVDIAENGASALACFSLREYDLVLMDCDLPDIDGYSLTVEWRRREADLEQARCPVIAISASTGTDHAERCFEAGMDGILSKPIRLAKLQDIVELWCDVTLVLQAPPMESLAVFDMPQVRAAFADDMDELLQAMAMHEHDTALRAAHRLHGAALAMQWAEMAQPAGKLESLLRSVAEPTDVCCSQPLQEVVAAWRTRDQH